jgi:hypothetical protein
MGVEVKFAIVVRYYNFGAIFRTENSSSGVRKH